MNGWGWIGVDLDGTLAHYDEWKGADTGSDALREAALVVAAHSSQAASLDLVPATVLLPLLAALVFAYPLLFMFTASFKPGDAIFSELASPRALLPDARWSASAGRTCSGMM